MWSQSTRLLVIIICKLKQAGQCCKFAYFKPKPGLPIKPTPRRDIALFDENYEQIKIPGKLGKMCMKLSMAPSFITPQMEKVLINHYYVAEEASKDDLKRGIPIGFVVMKSGKTRDHKELEGQLIAKVRKEMGTVVFVKCCMVVEKLPNTRSGKILRGLLKKIIDDEEYKINPAIEDESVIPVIEKKIREYELGKKSKLKFDENEG